jgi:hypothetical protein
LTGLARQWGPAIKVMRVSKLPTTGWKSLIAQETEQINDIRSEIAALAIEADLEIGEIR